MKKFFLILLISFHCGHAYAASDNNCDLCKALLSQVERECLIAMNCSNEQIIIIMEGAADMLPAVMANQARMMIETYGLSMAQLYNLGHDVNSICEDLALCDSGGGTDPCPECVNCNTTDWLPSSAGYQARIYEAVCNCGVCETKTEYRCADGYYGSSTNGSSGCTRCPALGGVYGNSSPGSKYVTSCYIPADVSISDGSGEFIFTPNKCFYSN